MDFDHITQYNTIGINNILSLAIKVYKQTTGKRTSMKGKINNELY